MGVENNTTAPPQELIVQYSRPLTRDVSRMEAFLEAGAADEHVIEYLESFDDSDRWHLSVHPGFTEMERWTPVVRGVDQEDYDAYTQRFREYVDSVAGQEPVFILYPTSHEETVREYIGDMEDDCFFFPSYDDSATLFRNTRKELAAVITEQNGSEAILSGEVNGRCVDYLWSVLDTVRELSDNPFSIQKDYTFPNNRVRYSQNELFVESAPVDQITCDAQYRHWQDSYREKAK